MVLNMGPHHPSMHGVLRLIVTLDGEDVIDCEPVLGYLHRGMEKIAENRTNIMFVPYVSRWDYAAGMFNEAITVNAPERLADIPVPKRASYIRVIMLELNRIANHLLWLGPFLAVAGCGQEQERKQGISHSIGLPFSIGNRKRAARSPGQPFYSLCR